MKTAEIRESFLRFMESKGCVRRPSSSLIPDDPSLLLTAAGMVQFKPVFLGVADLGFTRATTVQKCVRTTDIDIIGTTGRHLSFFEMLGNFSFGDYFKREAITWAWEYSTEVLGLDPEHIWVSVFEDDDEAEQLWLECTGIPAERIVRMGEKDNFWAAGPTGPCGPCSELYYDRGEEYSCGPDCAMGCECDRYLEYWNLVFMQYNRDEAGVLTPLPKQNIDTGMGLERIAAILQGSASNYETDLMQDIMALAQQLSGAEYGIDERTNVALRIITDHARSVAFMIADGILPSNEGRGYVLRRLLRRAARYGRLLGITEPFMVQMVEKVIELMSDAYGELSQHRELITGIVSAEEERFSHTLATGLTYLTAELDALPEAGTLSGVVAFTLHDTYGFPYDLTLEIAAEQGYSVDEEGFTVEMGKQKDRARAAVKDESWNSFGNIYAELIAKIAPTDFVGYAHNEVEAEITAIIVDGQQVQSVSANTSAEIFLDQTPFYGEQGGQVGDIGLISGPNDSEFMVSDTKIRSKVLNGHLGRVQKGELAVGQKVHAAIDVQRRERIRRNHTATHLLHWALRKVVGTHASQAGSAVSPERLRFDFTHFEGLTRDQLDKIERLVNAKVFENHPVRAYETSLDTARESGVTALFGEKYGDFVRVLEVGNFSKELCGGTHIGRTTEIGFLKIISESSVGANVRRIEAITSYDAYAYALDQEHELRKIGELLKSPLKAVADKVEQLIAKNKELASQAKQPSAQASAGALQDVAVKAQVVNEYKVFISRVEAMTASDLKPAWDFIRQQGVDAAVLFALDSQTGKPVFMAAANDAAVARGFNAGALVKGVAEILGGRGGGKPTMAQGGAEDGARFDEAIAWAAGELGATY